MIDLKEHNKIVNKVINDKKIMVSADFITNLQNEIEVTRNLLRLILKARKAPVDGNVSHFAPSFKVTQFAGNYIDNCLDSEASVDVNNEIKERLINLGYWE